MTSLEPTPHEMDETMRETLGLPRLRPWRPPNYRAEVSSDIGGIVPGSVRPHVGPTFRTANPSRITSNSALPAPDLEIDKAREAGMLEKLGLPPEPTEAPARRPNDVYDEATGEVISSLSVDGPPPNANDQSPLWPLGW